MVIILIGLAQINSYNLPKLNLTATQVLEPCTNLEASSTILKGFYLQAKQKFSNNQQALFHALSAYNTGSFHKGYEYASKVWRVAGGKKITNSFINIHKTIYDSPIMVKWGNRE